VRDFQFSSPLTPADWIRAPNGAQGKGRGAGNASPLASKTKTEKPRDKVRDFCDNFS